MGFLADYKKNKKKLEKALGSKKPAPKQTAPATKKYKLNAFKPENLTGSYFLELDDDTDKIYVFNGERAQVGKLSQAAFNYLEEESDYMTCNFIITQDGYIVFGV